MKGIDRLQYEEQLWSEGYRRVMGLDEVGRGCLSGPVVAAGVILSPNSAIAEVRDSKQLEAEERERLAGIIKREALYWTIQWCSVEEIDRLNILQASLKAMMKCTEADGAEPDYLLVDGNRYHPGVCPHTCLTGGDDRSLSIGAASIIAKVHRDELMRDLHRSFPHYGWETNVGYPTREHFRGLKKFGFTRFHRQSFRLRTTRKYTGDVPQGRSSRTGQG